MCILVMLAVYVMGNGGVTPLDGLAGLSLLGFEHVLQKVGQASW